MRSLRCHFACLIFYLLLSAGSILAARVPWTSNRVNGSPNPPSAFTVERAYPRFTFEHPVEFAFMPGSARLFVAEQDGKLWSFEAGAESSQAKADLALDARKMHQPLDNILGFTFHPGFATNRFIFINYNEPGTRENGAVVSRFTVQSLDPPTIDPASERVMLRWLGGGHNGCALAFGPDGFLYISTGDASDPDPPDSKRKTGQDISDLLASVLRIDVDHVEGTNSYSIPKDNPFVKTPGARPEVWAFGFRNPFRMSFAPDGALWVGDVGFELWEMIYRVKAGGNYGWAITEGPNTRVRTDVKQGPGPILPPMAAHHHSEAASITGGRFYRGHKLPNLAGAYVYGDWETGKFWALRHDGDRMVSDDEICDTTLQPVSFAEDRDGELLILNYTGGIYRFASNSVPPASQPFPRRLTQTGLFSDVKTLEPAAGVFEYRPKAAMWSDYATAIRHVGVPGGGAIVTADGRQTISGRMWDYPSNTVFTRTLTLEQQRGKPATARRIETQLLHFDGQAWNGYAFRWNAEQNDAELVPAAGTTEVLQMADATAPGGRREIHWRFMGRTECLRCHQCWAGDTLSFNWLQLGDPRPAPEAPVAKSSEMQRLAGLGVVRVKNPPKRRDEFHLADPYDASQPLADRARSWLHVNCAGCHRFNGGGVVPALLNLEKPMAETRILDVKPTRGEFELPAARVLAPGDPFQSVLYYRINTEGSGHMPLIGSRLADEAGIALVREWIRSLGNRPANPAVEPKSSIQPGSASERLANTSSALALIAGMEGATNLAPEILAAVSAHTNALIRDLCQRLLPPDRRRSTLGVDIRPETILALQGDATRGRALFTGASQCSRCHASDGIGRAFGPALKGLGRKYSRAQLLEQILNPSKIIAPEFRTIILSLRDGSELSGFVTSRTSAQLKVRDESLNEKMLALAEIVDARESVLSAMPEGLLAPLTAQEAADLLEFLVVE